MGFFLGAVSLEGASKLDPFMAGKKQRQDKNMEHKPAPGAVRAFRPKQTRRPRGAGARQKQNGGASGEP